jgi:hypothetical protein
LYFFREVANVPAWLVNVYFLNDPHSTTIFSDWQVALAEVKAALGLGAIIVPHGGEMFLEAENSPTVL